MPRINKWGSALGLVALAAAAGATTYALVEGEQAAASAAASGQASATAVPAGPAARIGGGGQGSGVAAAAGDSARGPRGTYIVVLQEDALATYQGTRPGLAAPQRIDRRGKQRLDPRSAAARSYVGYLQNRQAQVERAMAREVGRPLAVRERMQHALNAVVVDLDQREADAVRTMPDVRLVEEYREYALDTDVGPRLIGAEPVWDGSNPGAEAAYQGEGVVFGILDSGINFGSPSFAAVDPVDGYAHVNPLGDGSFLGSCAAGGVDEGRCNAKLIGGYDFVCGAPANLCGVPNIREEPGFGDTNSHGSHVASTAAGNRRDVVFRGNALRISGVAPRSNVVAYDVCYTNTVTGQGLCPNVSAVAAVNQAIADGVVDVINYSIGGGAQPWSEAVSLAFLNAVDAGIYVAASAGNSGPGPNTMGHLEPWVASTAAAQHGRGAFAVLLQVTGPQPVPEPLAPLIVNEGVNGVPHAAPIPGTTPLRISPGIDTAADGCAAFPAGSFDGAIAVVRRGSCSFSIKTNNASAAGAIAVVIANNADAALIPSVPGTTVPAFGVSQAEGNALRDFAAPRPDATAGIGFPSTPLPNTADALAAFSSRGPAGTFDLLKPDITAPGVSVLAVTAGATVTGFEQSIGLLSGTSMASPHHAGAAALIRQARPSWSVPEIKSALAMTAKQPVFLEDEVTIADPFARGSGRVQVDRAINAGLVMDETAANYLAANPAEGGDPSALNQPNLANGSCFERCTFFRTFRNPTDRTGLWRLQMEGLRAVASPAVIRVAPGESKTVKITVFSRDLPADGSWNFGSLVLTPLAGLDAATATLRLPAAVSVPPPVVSLPAMVSATLPRSRPDFARFSIGNIGGSTLQYAFVAGGTATAKVAEALRGDVASGFRSSFYTDPGLEPPAQFASDDFSLGGQTRLTSLFTEGFVISNAALGTVAANLTWSIYPDAGGVPAGNPQTAPGAAVWSYTAAPNAPGVSVAGNNIRLDLAAAGQDVVLPAGRYWLVVNARTTFANRWVWYASQQGDGNFVTISPGSAGTGVWTATPGFAGLSMTVTGSVQCGAPWLGPVVPPIGFLDPEQSRATSALIFANRLSPGTYQANLCVESNDPATPRAAAPITVTITP